MNNRRKFRYIKIKDDEPKRESAAKKKKAKTMKHIGNALTVIGTTISAMLLIFVIMMCIVVTIVTVYILDFADNGFDLNLRDAETKFTTFVYAYDEEGKEVEVQRLASEENRIWVNYEDISPNLIHAVIATEDKRFYEHQGVDWRRTVFSLGADVLNLSRAGEGGSTVTQQLIKNVTHDDEISWERKLREIFRALSLEKKHTKTDIMESYLNNIGWGGMNYGVGAASLYYFDKEPKDLTIAEAAILASMIKNPSKRSPYIDLENCKVHQVDTLYYMYDQGYINTDEYEKAQVEKVQFAHTVYGDDFGYTDPRSLPDAPPEQDPDNPDNPDDPNSTASDPNSTTSDPEDPEEDPDDDVFIPYRWDEYEISQDWYLDAALEQVYEDYAELTGKTVTSARSEISNGGYKIYINENMALQKMLEEKYKDPLFALYYYDENEQDSENLMQSAFVLMDYSGTVLALVGGLGDKPGDNCWNRATMSMRAPGSTMKPISCYSMGVELNKITYSTMIPDKGLWKLDDGTLWPWNYEFATRASAESYELRPVWYAVRFSRNTIACRVANLVTVPVLFDQLRSNLNITTLVPGDDEQLSPIPLGSLTNGIKLLELTAAYQIFGNGGVYYEPKLYSKVLDNKNNVILEQDFYGSQAISSDTAWVTNRMLRTVVTSPTGSGRYANLTNVETVGKTGTSSDRKNLTFVGLTPNYVAGVWLGIDNGAEFSDNGPTHKPALIWADVMKDVEDLTQVQKFTPDGTVEERQFCTVTGLLASEDCEEKETGYYRKSNIPVLCSGNHEYELKKIWAMWDAIDANDGTLPEGYVYTGTDD